MWAALDQRQRSSKRLLFYSFHQLRGLGVIMAESLRRQFERWDVEELLYRYPGLRLRPVAASQVIIAGTLTFDAEGPGKERIEDEYEIEIAVPERFPKWIPSVRETGGQIPPRFHKLDDGSLCLGSPTRLLLVISESPSISAFVEQCVVPYLYAYSYFRKTSHYALWGTVAPATGN